MPAQSLIRLLLCLFTLASALRADVPPKLPPSLEYRHEQRMDPAMQLHWITADLLRVKLRVVRGGPDPDGPGEFQTTLIRPSEIAIREKFTVTVNGDFFAIDRSKPQTPGQVIGKVLGPAMTDGQAWATAPTRRPCLVIRKDGSVHFAEHDSAPADAWQVMAGNVTLLRDGKAVEHQAKAKHPRTAAGLDEKGKRLTILVVDGRSAASVGMTYAELSAEMIRVGCHSAINLDGGGSTVLVLREADGRQRIMNTPSDGRERAVGNVLGLIADGD